MNEVVLDAIGEQLQSDPQFRAAFQHDPVAASEAAGHELDDDDRAAITAQDWSALSDDELLARASKSTRWYL
jgi:hypothetical protein